MTFDNECILISYSYSENDKGDPIKAKIESPVLCSQESVSRSEHYAAAAHGLKPEIILIVNQYDYEGQHDVEFEGVLYKIMRTYKRKQYSDVGDFDSLELVCAGSVNEHGNA